MKQNRCKQRNAANSFLWGKFLQQTCQRLPREGNVINLGKSLKNQHQPLEMVLLPLFLTGCVKYATINYNEKMLQGQENCLLVPKNRG